MAFLDLCGFTALLEEDPAAALGVVERLRWAVRSACDPGPDGPGGSAGVHVVKWLGDGVMLASGSPSLLLAALTRVHGALMGDRLPLRSGMAAGTLVLFDGGDLLGSAANLASRLCDAAPAGMVLAPASALAPGLAACAERDLLLVRGFSAPVEVVSLDPLACPRPGAGSSPAT